MYQCPITYFTDNLIFNIDRSCWAAYKLTGYDYDFLDDDRKIAMLYKMAKFLAGIMSDAQVLIVPVEQDSKEQFRSLIKRLDKDDPLYEQARFHATQTEAYLEQVKASKGDANDYRGYILVKLADYEDTETVTGIKNGYQYFIKNPANAINVFMNLDAKDILMSKLNDSIKRAEKWYFSQNQKIRLVELTGTEAQWLIRRMAYRGINEKVKLFREDAAGLKTWKPKTDMQEVGNERIIKPYGRDIINLFSGTIHTEKRMIRVEHDKNKVSYQTFLALTNIPDSFDYPGMEWIYMLQQYNLQAEVCIHITAVEYRAAQRKLDGKKREIESQIEHVESANADIPEDLLEGKAYADAMEAEIKNLREPLLKTSITICVAADDKEELERRVTTVKNEYEDMNFVVERPLADQLNLFMQCIPSVGCIVKDYIMPMTPLTLASGVIGASHELGDKMGPYIGTTGAEAKQVFLYMGLACLRNKSAAATFFGNLGVGKSFNANLLLVLNVLYGGYGLIFDPKAERSHWETDLKMLQGMITTVTLSSDPKNKGKLDPYNLYRDDIKAAHELAINVISELLKIAPTSMEYTAILEAQRIMSEQELPSMRLLIDVLRQFPDTDELCNTGKLLSRRLKLQADAGMSQLLFGDGTEEAISLDNRLNILQIDNLKLPSPETPKENYSEEESRSAVLMAVISNFAKRFAMTKRPVFKMVLFDESWMLGKTVEGVKLYDFLTRMGRSLFTGCIFNGHSVLDLPSEGIKNTISYKFCFQTTNDAEATRMCDYMGLESTPDNKETLKNLQNGECLFQDLDGHVGVLKFDAVFQDLIDVFSTTPKTDKKTVELEEPAQEKEETDELIAEETVSAEEQISESEKEEVDELKEAATEPEKEKVIEPIVEAAEPAKKEAAKPTQRKGKQKTKEPVMTEEKVQEENIEDSVTKAKAQAEEKASEEFDFDFDDEELFRKEVL